MNVRIEKWNGGQTTLIGVATVADDYPVADVAAESGGLATLVRDAEAWTGPDDYEWDGSEVYEIED